MVLWCLGRWFRGRLDGAGWLVGLADLFHLNDATILNESLEVLLLPWGGSSGPGVGCMQVLMFLCCVL